MSEPKPSAKNVEAVLLRQQDHSTWTPEMWAAHHADMEELYKAADEIVRSGWSFREQEEHPVEGKDGGR